MRFIFHSQINADSVRTSLGFPEYSYHFVMKQFTPAFERLGRIDVVADPQREVDEIFRSAAADEDDCLFVSFAPPHRTAMDLECPLLPVIAWEFTTIPDEVWDDEPRHDWRLVLSKTGRALALSTHTATVIRDAMGRAFHVEGIPVPMDAAWSPHKDLAYVLNPERVFIDSWALGLPSHSAAGSSRGGTQDHTAQLKKRPDIKPFSNLLEKARALFREQPPDRDTRLFLPAQGRADASRQVVYTSVFNPYDGRKNWLDIVTAFCWAFRDRPDVTLVLKTISTDIGRFKGELLRELLRLSPMRCRVIVLDGFLDDTDYQALVGMTTYYVNASNGEGMCLPLMEFMAQGKPAIAPDHTAMADYIDETVAFVLKSSLEHNVWPHDPRDLFRTMRYRISWASLLDGYEKSYAVATSKPDLYETMSDASRSRISRFCSPETVARKLESFLQEPVPAEPVSA